MPRPAPAAPLLCPSALPLAASPRPLPVLLLALVLCVALPLAAPAAQEACTQAESKAEAEARLPGGAEGGAVDADPAGAAASLLQRAASASASAAAARGSARGSLGGREEAEALGRDRRGGGAAESGAEAVRCLTGDYPDVGPVFREEHRPTFDWTARLPPAPGCEQRHEEDFLTPLRALLRPGEDGFCHFSFFSSCTAAVRAKDYAAYALAYSHAAGAQAAAEGPLKLPCESGYEAGDFRTAPGVFGYDAKLCHDNGFLDLPEGAYANFTLLTGLAAEGCAALRAEVEGTEAWSMLHNDVALTPDREAVMQAEARTPSALRRVGSPSRGELRRHEMFKCALWEPHGAACDMAYCQYNFCRLPDGRVGMGLQCREDWLSDDFVARHAEVFRPWGFPPKEEGPEGAPQAEQKAL